MKKNVSGQIVGAQMTTATDGSNFTSTVTVYVTGDGGTQAIGSVGSGICTHEGNGFHIYTPSQAETNYDHVAFTFIGTGAITQTVQLYPSFPQTGDAFARLGAPAGASVSADVASIKTDTGTTIPNRLPASLVSGRMDVSVGAYQAGLTPLQPTVSGRTLDVTATGEAGIDWANIGSPTTVVNLSGTTVKTATDVETDTADIQSRLPAALVSGRIDASVGAYQSGMAPLQPTVLGRTLDVTATGGAGIDWANVESPTTTVNLSGTTISTSQAVASVSGAVGSVTGLTAANLDVAVSTRLASASYTAPLDAAGVRTAVGLASANLDTQLTAIDDYLDTEVAAIKAKTDQLTFTKAGEVDANIQSVNNVTINGDGAGTPMGV